MGRGRSKAGSGTGGGSEMEVPYDKWGEEIRLQTVRDADGAVIGYITDEMRQQQVEDIRPTTKKEVLSEIDGYRNDDGTYGGEDERIYVAYDDGRVLTQEDLMYETKDGDIKGKKYPKKGIIGAALSTGDFEMVWGDEMVQRNGRMERVPIQTWSPDGESGQSNVMSGYKTTGVYMERVKTTHVRDKNGRIKTVREVIRRSTVKKME